MISNTRDKGGKLRLFSPSVTTNSLFIRTVQLHVIDTWGLSLADHATATRFAEKKEQPLRCNGDNMAVHHIYDVMHDLYDGYVYNIFLNISGERVQNFSHFSESQE